MSKTFYAVFDTNVLVSQPAPLPQDTHRRVAYRNDEDNKGKRITSPASPYNPREFLSAGAALLRPYAAVGGAWSFGACGNFLPIRLDVCA